MVEFLFHEVTVQRSQQVTQEFIILTHWMHPMKLSVWPSRPLWTPLLAFPFILSHGSLMLGSSCLTQQDAISSQPINKMPSAPNPLLMLGHIAVKFWSLLLPLPFYFLRFLSPRSPDHKDLIYTKSLQRTIS